MIDREQLKALVRELVLEVLAEAKPPAEPENITVAEYAAKHRLGVSTVRQYIREKRLPSIKIGRAVRIPAGAAVVPSTSSAEARRTRAIAIVHGGRR